jgi:hypothetical protein
MGPSASEHSSWGRVILSRRKISDADRAHLPYGMQEFAEACYQAV